jgi:hypothetical protein
MAVALKLLLLGFKKFKFAIKYNSLIIKALQNFNWFCNAFFIWLIFQKIYKITYINVNILKRIKKVQKIKYFKKIQNFPKSSSCKEIVDWLYCRNIFIIICKSIFYNLFKSEKVQQVPYRMTSLWVCVFYYKTH